RGRGLSVDVRTPARKRPISPHPARVMLAGVYDGKRSGRTAQLAPFVRPPTNDRSVGLQSTTVVPARAHRREGAGRGRRLAVCVGAATACASVVSHSARVVKTGAEKLAFRLAA